MRVPERALVRLPAGAALGDACLVEPLAVVLHGLRRARAVGGERVAVIGGGAIGLCAVAAARAAGAEVALEARHDAQRAAGERLGANARPTGSFDLVVDAAGTESSFAKAAELARPGGRVALVGSYWTPVQFPGFGLCLKEIDVIPASMYGAWARCATSTPRRRCSPPRPSCRRRSSPTASHSKPPPRPSPPRAPAAPAPSRSCWSRKKGTFLFRHKRLTGHK
jgi:threonine dehydrogenase-like Zn-dependent dehydrogenase